MLLRTFYPKFRITIKYTLSNGSIYVLIPVKNKAAGFFIAFNRFSKSK